MNPLENLFAIAEQMAREDRVFGSERCSAKHLHDNCLLWKFRGDVDYKVLRDAAMEAKFWMEEGNS